MLRITKDGVPSLRAPSKEVPLPLEEKDRKLLMDMLEHLKESQDDSFREKHPSVREGIGLAAPQAGVNRRLLVIHYPKDGEGNYQTYCLANPRIVSQSVKECYLESGEGCLSVDKEHPGYSYRSYRIRVEAYDGLTVDFACRREAKFIIRGIRTVHDFEYEETIADINRKLAGIETILLFTEPELTAISSTIVRELLSYGKDVSSFLPVGLDINV